MAARRVSSRAGPDHNKRHPGGRRGIARHDGVVPRARPRYQVGLVGLL